MTDTFTFFAKELTVQMAGGVAMGSAINFFFPSHSPEKINKNPVKTFLEVLIQTLAAGAASLFFIEFLRGRGIDPQTTLVGLAPFWIYFLGAQPKMTRKTAGLIDYVWNKVETLDPEIGKEVEEIKKIV